MLIYPIGLSMRRKASPIWKVKVPKKSAGTPQKKSLHVCGVRQGAQVEIFAIESAIRENEFYVCIYMDVPSSSKFWAFAIFSRTNYTISIYLSQLFTLTIMKFSSVVITLVALATSVQAGCWNTCRTQCGSWGPYCNQECMGRCMYPLCPGYVILFLSLKASHLHYWSCTYTLGLCILICRLWLQQSISRNLLACRREISR